MPGTNVPAVDRVIKIVRELDLYRAFLPRTEPKGPQARRKSRFRSQNGGARHFLSGRGLRAFRPRAARGGRRRTRRLPERRSPAPSQQRGGRNRKAAQAAGMSRFASRNGVPVLVSWSRTGARGGRRRMRNRPGPQAVEISRFRSQSSGGSFCLRLASPPPSPLPGESNSRVSAQGTTAPRTVRRSR